MMHTFLEIIVLFHAILNNNSLKFGVIHKGQVQYKAVHRHLSLCTKADLDIQQKGILTTLVKWCYNQAYKYFIWEFLFQLTSEAMLSLFFFFGINSTSMHNFIHIFLIINICLFMFLIVCKHFAHKSITCSHKMYLVFSKFPLHLVQCQIQNDGK